MSIQKLALDVSEQRLVSLTRDLIALPSENPPGNEAGMANYVAEFLRNLGTEPLLVEAAEGRPNVLVSLPGASGGPTLLLTGHTDVVPAGANWSHHPFDPVVVGGRIYGRGACDMKGGLACILHVVELLLRHESPLVGSLLCAFTVGEETGGLEGAAYLVEHGHVKADMGILLEPSDFKLVLAEEAVLWARLTTHGTTTHTLNAAKATNAVEKMAPLLTAILSCRGNLLRCESTGAEPPILSVNMITGGEKPNVIPGRCEACIDIRIPPSCSLSVEEVQRRLLRMLGDARAGDPTLDADAKCEVVARAFSQPRDSEIVRILGDCATKVLGRPADIVGPVPSTDEDSDAYHYWTKGKIPTVYFGPGHIAQAHAADEYVEAHELVWASKILICAISRLCDAKSALRGTGRPA